MKITVKQLKQLIKEEVSKRMLLEYEKYEYIDPETGMIMIGNDEGSSRWTGKMALEHDSQDMTLDGYYDWEANGFPFEQPERRRHRPRY